MREVIWLTSGWKYKDAFSEDYVKVDLDEREFCEVNLPHTNIETPYNYFDEKMYQFESCYRKCIHIPSGYQGRRIYIDFEGVMAYAAVYVNGRYVGENKGGYTPFSFDITDHLSYGSNNIIAVRVDSRERPDIPPFGGSVDYLTYGGIYREVSLRVVNPLFIENVRAIAQDVLSDHKKLAITAFLRDTLQAGGKARIEVLLKRQSEVLERSSCRFELSGEKEPTLDLVLGNLTGIELWNLDTPDLYGLQVLLFVEGQVVDTYETRIGFRTAEIKADGFWLNGEKLKIRGLNRHQSYPYVGYAMPRRVQRRDADILKYELGLNTVRTSHYPQSRHFLDRCDEIGLLVFEEIPGWQHIGDAEWKQVACQDVYRMVIRDWNHPCIFLWGVRINESGDDHDFYVETNRIARELDSSRQTGGVRWIHRSELLEDVYTINDFSHSGGKVVLADPRVATGLDRPVPYMVTEYAGHMYPTKRFDHEERLMEHAMRHLRVQNAAGLHPNIAGAIGWCAFDYNTHYEFGSGDRICYHGVMDMFRIPKYAAYVYRSQVHPKEGAVLEPATLWSRGERSIGGVIPLAIFTNCDYVELSMDGKHVGRFYPAKDLYPGVPHPPIIIKEAPREFGDWGFHWPDGEFVGYVNNQEVIRKKYCSNPVATRLEGKADDAVLCADEVDATRVVYRVLDQAGNVTPFINEAIRFEIEGPGEVIGPKDTALIAGCIGVWVKTVGELGTIVLKATSSRFKANDVRITVE